MKFNQLKMTVVHSSFLLIISTLQPLMAAEQDCYIQDTLCFSVLEKRVDYIKDELLVQFPKEYTKEEKEKLLKTYQLDEVGSDSLDSLGITLGKFKTNGQDPLALTNTINRTHDEIEASTNNTYLSALSSKVSRKHYPHSLTGAGLALNYSEGEGVLIGLIDGPVDITHPTFQGRIQQINLLASNPRSVAYLSHGSAMAGVLISNNPRIGIAPKARLLSISAFNYVGNNKNSSSSGLIARAINIAIQKKVDILNLSFSGGEDPLVTKLIQKAISAGIIVVAACGNDNSRKPTYPAAIPGVLAVTAVDHLKRIYVSANTGSYIDVAAPGVGVLTTAPGNRYRLSTGTSLAAANVSASLALLLAKRPQINRELLSNTAVDLGAPGHDTSYGDGLINVIGAMKRILR